MDTNQKTCIAKLFCNCGDNARRTAQRGGFSRTSIRERTMPRLHLPTLGRFLLYPLAFGALAACSATSGTTPDPSTWPKQLTSGEAPRSTCDAQAAEFLEQQPYAQDTLERALKAAGADEARVLLQSEPVTKEYQMGRLNVIVDDDMRTVLRVRCG